MSIYGSVLKSSLYRLVPLRENPYCYGLLSQTIYGELFFPHNSEKMTQIYLWLHWFYLIIREYIFLIQVYHHIFNSIRSRQYKWLFNSLWQEKRRNQEIKNVGFTNQHVLFRWPRLIPIYLKKEEDFYYFLFSKLMKSNFQKSKVVKFSSRLLHLHIHIWKLDICFFRVKIKFTY